MYACILKQYLAVHAQTRTISLCLFHMHTGMSWGRTRRGGMSDHWACAYVYVSLGCGCRLTLSVCVSASSLSLSPKSLFTCFSVTSRHVVLSYTLALCPERRRRLVLFVLWPAPIPFSPIVVAAAAAMATATAMAVRLSVNAAARRRSRCSFLSFFFVLSLAVSCRTFRTSPHALVFFGLSLLLCLRASLILCFWVCGWWCTGVRVRVSLPALLLCCLLATATPDSCLLTCVFSLSHCLFRRKGKRVDRRAIFSLPLPCCPQTLFASLVSCCSILLTPHTHRQTGRHTDARPPTFSVMSGGVCVCACLALRSFPPSPPPLFVEVEREGNTQYGSKGRRALRHTRV